MSHLAVPLKCAPLQMQTGYAAIYIYKKLVIPRNHLYINPHLTGVRNSYVITTARLHPDRIWHERARSIFGQSSILAALHAQHMLKGPTD